MNQKGFSIVLILIGILLVAVVLIGGAYYFSRSISPKPSTTPTVTSQSPQPSPSDETANWKIYTGTGFTIKYPPGLEYTNLTAVNPAYDGLKNASCTGFQTTGAMADVLFSVCIIADSADKISSDLKTYINQAGGSLGQIIDTKEVSFSDFNGTELTTENKVYKPSVVWSYLIISKNNSTYVISHSKNKEEDLMFSTLKFLDKQTNIASLCLQESETIKNLINTFESLQMKNDALGVLALFTPPVTNEDKDTYNFFTGKKEGYIALYGNVTTKVNEPSYQIMGDPLDNPNGCTVNVEEQRRSYSNSGASVGFGPPQPVKFSLNVVKQANQWKIDRYYITGQNAGKYSAWGY